MSIEKGMELVEELGISMAEIARKRDDDIEHRLRISSFVTVSVAGSPMIFTVAIGRTTALTVIGAVTARASTGGAQAPHNDMKRNSAASKYRPR